MSTPVVDLTAFDTLRATVAAQNSLVVAQASQLAAQGVQLTELSTELDAATAADLLDPWAGKICNIETLTNWIQAGRLGNSAGNTATGTFVMTPGSAGVPATFSAKGNAPYADSYWYTCLTPQPTATRFRQSLEFKLPTAADLAACQAVEFELQQVAGGFLYNMAWQMDLASKKWRIFNYALNSKGTWLATSIPVNVSAGVWNTIVADYCRFGTTMTHIGIWINGVWFPVMMNIDAVASNGNTFNAGFQLDTNGKKLPPPFVCNVRNYAVSWV